jgi:ABC-type molybdate transport system substrate-binding protein
VKNKDDLPEIPADRGDDLHNLELMENADLVLFMAGNQFMIMPELLEVFQKEHPGVRRIFYETLPPGLELKQILAGGAKFGNTQITVTPDIYSSVTESAMIKLAAKGLVEDYFVYLHNRVVLMVPEENPAGVRTVGDLARTEVRISHPGPLEDITVHITNMYRKAGGEALVKRIMEEKRAQGATIFTTVHHRETPLKIKEGAADVGPVWATEVLNACKEGLGVAAIEPGAELDQRDQVNYFIAGLKKAPHPANAVRFLDFIQARKAQDIYRRYGFVPHFAV